MAIILCAMTQTVGVLRACVRNHAWLGAEFQPVAMGVMVGVEVIKAGDTVQDPLGSLPPSTEVSKRCIAFPGI